jgi:hypothetical protein
VPENKSRKKSKTENKRANSSFSLTLNRKVLLGFVGVAAVLAIGVTVLVLVVPTKLEAAYSQCAKSAPDFATHSALDEDGNGWFLDGKGEDSPGLGMPDLACAIQNVAVPDSVVSRMQSTTALMGQQEATFDGITVRWSYHPSNGLDMSFEMD